MTPENSVDALFPPVVSTTPLESEDSAGSGQRSDRLRVEDLQGTRRIDDDGSGVGDGGAVGDLQEAGIDRRDTGVGVRADQPDDARSVLCEASRSGRDRTGERTLPAPPTVRFWPAPLIAAEDTSSCPRRN